MLAAVVGLVAATLVGPFGPGLSPAAATTATTAGLDWTAVTAPTGNWYSVVYGGGQFVAVGFPDSTYSGPNRVMTSPDGATWTAQSIGIVTTDSWWRSVAYGTPSGTGLYVAVAQHGTDRVMTSPDGATWTKRTAPTGEWRAVTWGNGKFVAVGMSGIAMTSTDGVTWQATTTPNGNSWMSVTYGGGLFVAVGDSGSGNRVMTSPDGATWTLRSSAADINWHAVAYGGGMFVAVAWNAMPHIMTSPTGETWQAGTPPSSQAWDAVTYGGGRFVAVSDSGSGYRVMTSIDGTSWESRPSTADLAWHGLAYGAGTFVAVAYGAATSVMVSAPQTLAITTTSLPTATEGSPYSAALTATGGVEPYAWAVTAGALPAGLSLSPTTGAITGTPTAAGTDPVTFTVADAQGTPATATATLALGFTALPRPPAPSGGGGTTRTPTPVAITLSLAPTSAPASVPSSASVDDPASGIAQAGGFFRPRSASINVKGRSKIATIARSIPTDASVVRIRVIGVSTSLLTAAQNVALARSRARAVAAALRAQGVSGVFDLSVFASVSGRALDADAEAVMRTADGRPVTTVTAMFRVPAGQGAAR